MHNRGLCFLLQLIPYAVTLPETISIPAFQSFTLAILLFFAGQKIAEYWGVIRRYSIPEPVVGGFACALVVGLIYYTTGSKIEFDLNVRDTLLLYFFAAIGLRSDLLTLKQGGKPLLILLALAGSFGMVLLAAALVSVRPLQDWAFGTPVGQTQAHLNFTQIKNVDDLNSALLWLNTSV